MILAFDEDAITVDGIIGRLWMCKRKDGHILGIVVAVCIPNVGMIEHLYVFRQAVSLDEKDQAQILGRVEGTVYDIACTLCDAKRTWYEGKGALKRAIASYGKRKL